MQATVSIPLRRRSGELVGHALVDLADAWRIGINWSLQDGYVRRMKLGVPELLHRVVCGLVRGDGMEADHINGDRLDCRRSNLRVVTRAQNAQNRPNDRGSSSKYRGVSRDTARQRWRAAVQVGGNRVFLGNFIDEDAAGRAVMEYRTKHMPFTVEARSVDHAHIGA